jgi:hypothetical protein
MVNGRSSKNGIGESITLTRNDTSIPKGIPLGNLCSERAALFSISGIRGDLLILLIISNNIDDFEKPMVVMK